MRLSADVCFSDIFQAGVQFNTFCRKLVGASTGIALRQLCLTYMADGGWLGVDNLSLLTIFALEVYYYYRTKNFLFSFPTKILTPSELTKEALNRYKKIFFAKALMSLFSFGLLAKFMVNRLDFAMNYENVGSLTKFDFLKSEKPDLLFMIFTTQVFDYFFQEPKNLANIRKDNHARLAGEITGYFKKINSPFSQTRKISFYFDSFVYSNSVELIFNKNVSLQNYCRENGINENIRIIFLTIIADFLAEIVPGTIVLSDESITLAINKPFQAKKAISFTEISQKLASFGQELKILTTIYHYLKLSGIRIQCEYFQLQLSIPANCQNDQLLQNYSSENYLSIVVKENSAIIKVKNIDLDCSLLNFSIENQKDKSNSILLNPMPIQTRTKYQETSSLIQRLPRQRQIPLDRMLLFQQNRPPAFEELIVDFGEYGCYDSRTPNDRIKLLHGYDNIFIALDGKFKPKNESLLKRFNELDTNSNDLYIQPKQKMKSGVQLFVKLNPRLEKFLWVGDKAFCKVDASGKKNYIFILNNEISAHAKNLQATNVVPEIPRLEEQPSARLS